MKTLINFVISCTLVVRINAPEPNDKYVCPHEISIYLDWSYTMCNTHVHASNRMDEPDCTGPTDPFLCGETEEELDTLDDQKDAIDELVDRYNVRSIQRQYATSYPEDANLLVSKYSDNVTRLFSDPINTYTHSSISVGPGPECTGRTRVQEVYRDFVNTCQSSYSYNKAQPCIIMSDMHWYPEPDEADVEEAISLKNQIDGLPCPIFCIQIGNDSEALSEEELLSSGLCDKYYLAESYDDIYDNVNDYVDMIVDILLGECETMTHTMPDQIYYSPTPTPYVEDIEPYQAPYEDPPVVVSSDSKDGFWWWWILLAAIGALLCCLGGALAYKNKRKPELDIQHENMDLPCEDEVVVDDAQIHIRH